MPSPKSFACPACGENVPAKAKACPHCGACEKSGWNEEASAGDGLDLPGDDFDYDKFVAEEFGGSPRLERKQIFWKMVAVVVLVLMIALTAADMMFR
jgi:hypothetical protein